MSLAIRCEGCKRDQDLFEYDLDESAVLTCPVCGTKFLLTATVKSSVKREEEPELQRDLSLPEPPSATQVPPPPAAPSPPGAAENFDITSLEKNLMEGMSIDKALRMFLHEEEIEKEKWKGGLGVFNAKLQALASDIGYDGDLGDLVDDLRVGEALEMRGENVELDLEKARRVLVKYVINKLGDVPSLLRIGGDDEDLLRPEDEHDLIGGDGERGFNSKVSVSKAVDLYFS
jgi:ribosomal protein S27E